MIHSLIQSAGEAHNTNNTHHTHTMHTRIWDEEKGHWTCGVPYYLFRIFYPTPRTLFYNLCGNPDFVIKALHYSADEPSSWNGLMVVKLSLLNLPLKSWKTLNMSIHSFYIKNRKLGLIKIKYNFYLISSAEVLI